MPVELNQTPSTCTPTRLRTGPPADDDESLGAHLLRIRDADGRPLPDERLLPHIGMIFFAGMDTTGHTMSWTL
jgi:fatty acid synthase